MQAINRRTVLLGMLPAATLGARAQVATLGSALRARDFIDSIGVNTHISSEPYSSRFETVMRLVANLGVLHLRDELRPSNDLGRWTEFYQKLGVKSHLLVSPSTNTIAEMSAYINKLGKEKISVIEGQNEGNADWFMAHKAARGNWVRTVIDYQREVFDTLRQRRGTSMPIVSPSVINWKPADMALLRDAAPYCDYVAIHSYPQHAEEPETGADFAALSWYLKHMRDTFKPGAPVMATETGYNTTIKPGGSGVSERAASIYLPRMLLYNFAQGVERTVLYQLLDGGDDPNEWEHHFGLVRHDDTPKPAYTAIANLIDALKEPKRSNPRLVGPLRISLRNPPKPTVAVELSHDDGTMTLALWRAVRSWDVEKAADMNVTPETLSLGADRPLLHARMLTPNDGRNWEDVPVRDGELLVPVADKVVLVRVTPAA